MIVTLSPTKLLDFQTPVLITNKTKPIFSDETAELVEVLKHISPTDLSQLMNINPKIGFEVYQYVQAFDMPKTPQRQAALAYNGIAYKGLDPQTFSTDDWNFAQDHLIMISALYGLLRPLDSIKPYRLEFLTKLETNKGKNIYDFWGKKLTEVFAKRMIEDDNTWLNVTSGECSKAIDKKGLPKGAKIINAVFKEDMPQGPKMIVVYAKKARGMMARYVIENKITKIEDVKNFDSEGYCFSPSLSNDKDWVFTR